jgi:TM2 domain-containing membrane protein YozV
MTETAGAICPTCTASLPAAGTPCPRCAPHGAAPGFPQLPYAPYQPYQGMPRPPMTHPSMAQPPAPYQAGPYQPGPYQPAPYPPGPYQPVPSAARAPKSSGVAVLLTLLWIGAGHLYLDRIGTGLALMGAHFVLGFMLFFVFAPLGFLVWLGAVIGCCVWVSNLTAQINAGTVPPRQTW